jgi:pimeloyl-ACP methyl ester carboxylesterase
MNRTTRMLLTGLALVGVVAGSSPAATAAPKSKSEILPAGTVLSAVKVSLPSGLDALATGVRTTYVTTDINGNKIPATGLVMTPKKKPAHKTVVWAHGTTGLSDNCAPSTNHDVFWPEAVQSVQEMLSRGWTVTAPDYPGLGTSQAHPYLVGESAARSVIDSVKAARKLDRSLKADYAVDGHSQGGQAALYVNQIAPSYDGDLKLAGTVAIAPVSNMDAIAPYIPGSPVQGYLPMVAAGIAAVDPTFDVSSVFTDEANKLSGVLETGCLFDILAAYGPLTAEQLVPGGVVPDALMERMPKFGNPGATTTTAPVMVVQGTDDEAVPFDITAGLLVPQLEQYSQPVDFVAVDGANHDGSVFQTTKQVGDWIADKFAAKK